MDLTPIEFRSRTSKELPVRKTSPSIGVKHFNLTLVDYGIHGDRLGHFYQCDCGGYCFVIQHGTVVRGGNRRCSICKVLSLNKLRYENFLLRYNNKFKDYPLVGIDLASWKADTIYISCKDHGKIRALSKSDISKRSVTPCRECNEQIRRKKRSYSQEDYISICKKVHENKYSYKSLVYKGITEKVDVFCPDHNGLFSQDAWEHKNGAGCNVCTTGGFRSTRKGVLYISKWFGFIKTGVTNSTADRRKGTQQDRSGLTGEVVYTTPRLDGRLILDLELEIKHNFDLGYISRDIFPDGFSETLPVTEEEKLTKFIINYLKQRETLL